MPEQPRGISGFQLKVAAIAAMTCNHVAREFGGMLPGWLGFALYAVGGMTFPIMAFLLVEGYLHTSNLRNYALRLAGFAAVAQVPYSLLWGATGNVLFTLLLGLGVLWASDRWGQSGATAGVVVAAILFSAPLDWGLIGPAMVYLFFAFRTRAAALDAAAARRENAKGVCITMLVPLVCVAIAAMQPFSANDLGYALVGFPAAAALLCAYSGRRGRSMKWFFYAYYPLHLFAIWGLRVYLS